MSCYYDYENELTPVFNWHDASRGGKAAPEYTTEEQKKEYYKAREKLEKLRREEPAKKRGRKLEYRCWVYETHDLRDYLNEVAVKLRAREKTERNSRDT